jgi:hypothetical protein
MRTLVVSLAAVLCLILATSAQAADRHMFIIGANAGGYGVDRCLVAGAKCGAAAADAYCRGQQYKAAASYNAVDRDDITGAIPSDGSGGCHGGRCDNLVAIVCTR